MNIQKLQSALQNLHYRKEAFFIAIVLVILLIVINYKVVPALTPNNPRLQRSLQSIFSMLLFAVSAIIAAGAMLLWLTGNHPSA